MAPAARIAAGPGASTGGVGGSTVVGLVRPSTDDLAGQRQARLRAEHAATTAATTAGSTALGAPSAGDATDTTALLLQLERELDRVAEEIHEGPAQALAAARFAADAAALRGADVTAVREAVQDALAAVRRAVWELRTPAVSSGLGEALAGLSERMDDGPGLTLQGRPADLASLSLVPSVVATSAYRLVQAALRAATSPVRIGVAAGVGVVELTVRGHGLTATDRAEWALRLSAVGAHLVAEPSALRLLLPTSAPDEPARRA